MDGNFKILCGGNSEIGVLSVEGYLGEEAGQELLKEVEKLLCKRVYKIVFDFEKCAVISSPGVSSLLEISGKIVGEFQGKTAYSGLDTVKERVLRFMGILENAPVVKSVEEAKKSLALQ